MRSLPGKKNLVDCSSSGPGQFRFLRRWEVCFIDWSWDHEQHVGKHCIQITLSNSTLYTEWRTLLRSAQHLQQHHLSRTYRYSIGIFLNDEEWVFFYDLHRSFCNSGYFFCTRNSKVCCEKETYLSDFRVRKTRKSIIDWNSLPSDLFWIKLHNLKPPSLTTFLQCDVYPFRFIVLP